MQTVNYSLPTWQAAGLPHIPRRRSNCAARRKPHRNRRSVIAAMALAVARFHLCLAQLALRLARRAARQEGVCL